MNKTFSKAALTTLALLSLGSARADYGVGLKAGSLGFGLEGRWKALPWLDVRLGANLFDYEDAGSAAGINYDAIFGLESFYATGNFRFPLSPFRVTAGVYSNGNEYTMTSQDLGGSEFNIGNSIFNPADVGTLQSVTSFDSTAPYLGIGYDFEVFGKVGLNLDFGVLWQGEPTVTLVASGLQNAPPAVRSELETALEIERLELESEMSDFKAWPVVSLGFVYNF